MSQFRKYVSSVACGRIWCGRRSSIDQCDARKETSHAPTGGREMAYHLEGRLLEVCDCRVLCPCWIGEDPDNGTCDSVLAYHFDAGTVDGVDVTGRTIALVEHPATSSPATSASPSTWTKQYPTRRKRHSWTYSPANLVARWRRLLSLSVRWCQ